jgi:hypothetical protein
VPTVVERLRFLAASTPPLSDLQPGTGPQKAARDVSLMHNPQHTCPGDLTRSVPRCDMSRVKYCTKATAHCMVGFTSVPHPAASSNVHRDRFIGDSRGVSMLFDNACPFARRAGSFKNNHTQSHICTIIHTHTGASKHRKHIGPHLAKMVKAFRVVCGVLNVKRSVLCFFCALFWASLAI